jgi:uncharacterized protein (DUF433 family)
MLVLGRIEVGRGMDPPRLVGSGLEVHRLLAELAERGSFEALLSLHPDLTTADVRALLIFAAESVESDQLQRGWKIRHEGQALQELTAAFALPPGRCVARFTAPFPAARHWLASLRNPAPTAAAALCLAMRDGELAFESAAYSVSDPNTTALATLIAHVCAVGTEEIEGDPCLLAMRVAGDFVFRAAAVRADRLDDLGPLLERALDLPLRLSLGEATRSVLVARGHASCPGEVQVQAADTGLATGGAGGGSGDLGRFLAALGQFLGRRIVDEVAEPRPAAVAWRYHHHGACTGPAEDPAAVALVLDRVREQTGIQFVSEARAVRVVTVSLPADSAGRAG